jgi:hypothetical protein
LPSDQKEIFRKVLQLDDYVLYHDETGKRIKLKNTDTEKVERSISLNSSLLESIKKDIILIQEEMKNFEVRKNLDIEKIIKDLNLLESQLTDLKLKESSYLELNLDENYKIISNQESEIDGKLKIVELNFSNGMDSIEKNKKLKLAEFKSQYDNLMSEENLKKSENESKLNSIYQERLSSLREKSSSLDNKETGLNKEKSNNNNDIKKNEKEINELNISLNKPEATCPTCGKLLSDETIKNKLTKKLDSLNSQNELLQSSIDEIEVSLKTILNDKKDINKLFEEDKLIFQEKINEINEEYKINTDRICERLNDAKIKLEEAAKEKQLEEMNIFDTQRSELDKQLILLGNERIRLENLIKEYDLLIDLITSIIGKINSNKEILEIKKNEKFNSGEILENYYKKLEILEKEKISLQNEKNNLIEDLEILDFWKTGFSSSGIPSLLIDESIPFLNSSVSKYLEKIGGRYIVSFDTISTTKAGEYRDKINVNVLDTYSKANQRKQLSGGQTRIIDVAILLSLCDLQNNIQDMKTNILLLDEIFDSLDDTNIGHISSLLRTLVKDKSINIISHRHIDSIEADEIIRLF